MSLVRWGQDGSNVYIIGADDPDGDPAWLCSGCDLNGRWQKTSEGMSKHLKDHERLGHCVPAWVYEELETESP